MAHYMVVLNSRDSGGTPTAWRYATVGYNTSSSATPADTYIDGRLRHAGLLQRHMFGERRLRAQGGRCGDLNYLPAPPLRSAPALRCAARLHSQDMHIRQYLGQVDPDHQRQVEHAADAGPDGLRVVHLDRIRGQDDGVGTEGVRAPDHRARVAGVADLRADHHQPDLGRDRLGERHVQRPADRDDPLRGDGVGDGGDVLLADRVVRDSRRAGRGQQFEVIVDGRPAEEHRLDDLRLLERLTHRLRTLDQELPRRLALLAAQQCPGGTQHCLGRLG